MKLYRTAGGYIVEHQDHFYAGADASWDELITREDLEAHLTKTLQQQKPMDAGSFADIEKRFWRPSAARKSGPRGSPTIAAATPAWRKRRPPEAATSMIACTLRNVLNFL